ncbi:MAG: hypothetical protein U5Q03_03105 [Bacteroidota bacterium]|nr:hypothetical protein [Bacteroidota bacterium]
MKSILVLLVFSLIISSCSKSPKQDKNLPDEDDFKILHLDIERSKTDTVIARMQAFYKKFDLPATAAKLPDGHYFGESPYDDFQYRHLIRFDIEDGRFSNVQYDEVKINGSSKTADEEYCRKMNEHVPGSAPDITYDKYEKQVEQKQNLFELDAISGATYSMYRLQLVAAKAIVDHTE